MSRVMKYEFIAFETNEVKKVVVPKELQERLESLELPIVVQCGSENGLLRRVTT